MITPPKWKTIPKVEGQNEQKVILGQLRRDRKTRRTTLPQPMSGAKIPGRAAPESIPVYPGSGAKAPASGAIPDTVVDRDSADKKRGVQAAPYPAIPRVHDQFFVLPGPPGGASRTPPLGHRVGRARWTYGPDSAHEFHIFTALDLPVTRALPGRPWGPSPRGYAAGSADGCCVVSAPAGSWRAAKPPASPFLLLTASFTTSHPGFWPRRSSLSQS